MREIKFRAWEEERRLMFEPVVMDLMIDFKGDIFSVDIDSYKPVTDLKIMQYSGLKDVNDVGIFEGDIVDVNYMSFKEFRGVVNFGQYIQDGSGGEYSGSECMGFYIKVLNPDMEDEYGCKIIQDYEKECSLLGFDRIEIIGNIYENPDLLEGT